jgi:hypothetical protein
MNYHLSTHTIEHKKPTTYGIGNPSTGREYGLGVMLMVFNTTFNNISIIL